MALDEPIHCQHSETSSYPSQSGLHHAFPSRLFRFNETVVMFMLLLSSAVILPTSACKGNADICDVDLEIDIAMYTGYGHSNHKKHTRSSLLSSNTIAFTEISHALSFQSSVPISSHQTYSYLPIRQSSVSSSWIEFTHSDNRDLWPNKTYTKDKQCALANIFESLPTSQSTTFAQRCAPNDATNEAINATTNMMCPSTTAPLIDLSPTDVDAHPNKATLCASNMLQRQRAPLPSRTWSSTHVQYTFGLFSRQKHTDNNSKEICILKGLKPLINEAIDTCARPTINGLNLGIFNPFIDQWASLLPMNTINARKGTDLGTLKAIIDTNPSFSFQQIVSCILYVYFMPQYASFHSMIFALSTVANAQTLTVSPTRAPVIPRITGSNISCTDIDQCRYFDITCLDYQNCHVQCGGEDTTYAANYACASARIYCPLNSGNCSVDCDSNSACQGVHIYGGGGDLVVRAHTLRNAFEYATIDCPNHHSCSYTSYSKNDRSITINGNHASILNFEQHSGTNPLHSQSPINCPYQAECNILCGNDADGSQHTCYYNINAQNASILNMEVLPSTTKTSGLNNVRCPIDGIRGNTNTCNIFGYNPNSKRLLEDVRIYAVEGLNDVNLTCIGPCFTQTNPRIYCKEGFDDWCTITSISDDHFNNWQCVEDNHADCENYLYPTDVPTPDPTVAPTPQPTIGPTKPTSSPTAAPSTSPITYDPPYSSETVLYARINGCDYGDCTYSSFDDFSTYCNDSFVYNDNDYCCATYPAPNNTVTTTITPMSCDNTVTINNTTVFENSFVANAESAVLCFEIHPDAICYHPA
eukprot:161290_1